MTIIYADLTFFLNTGLNCLVLCCTARLTGLPARWRRMLAAAALGGAYGVLAALPPLGFLNAFFAKCALSLAMAAVAFGRGAFFLRRYLLFLAVSCTLSGASVGAAAILRRTESPWVIFLVSGLFCAFVLSVVFHRSADPEQAAQILEATILCGEKAVTVQLLQNGQEVQGETLTLTQEEDWRGTFADLLPYDENGRPFVYAVQEEPVSDYTAAVTGSAAAGFTITNTYEPKQPTCL